MAAKKDYAYYIKGNKIAIIQKDTQTISGVAGTCSLSQYTTQSGCEDNGGTWTPSYSSSTEENGMYKSPFTTVTDGLEIQYAYSPEYRINDIEDKSTAITGYDESSGLLKFTGSGLSTDAAITHIVISGSEKWNGLHKINTLNGNYWIVETKYNGAVVTESVTAYTDISVLVDESSVIDLPRYQTNAITYYLKAKMAEDMGDMEKREFFMREFKRQLEKSTSALKRGPYMVQGFKEMR